MREKILNMLEKNSRIDIKDMAVMLGISEPEVANEIADMEKEHIICGYNTIIDWVKRVKKRLRHLLRLRLRHREGLDLTALLKEYTSMMR